ncbi:hypothetical protein LSTR_LSTR007480 [Laodelphax striatellus]|uniref:Uncharacterized protein n=1 Tax=Laodelphax striatellus TaxID=195883 RepID=A0A482X478_LAOST|nr:hypothetical protein LSTR_LSTR007480 [Laodelphax striatellus]
MVNAFCRLCYCSRLTSPPPPPPLPPPLPPPPSTPNKVIEPPHRLCALCTLGKYVRLQRGVHVWHTLYRCLRLYPFLPTPQAPPPISPPFLSSWYCGLHGQLDLVSHLPPEYRCRFLQR